MIRKMVRNIYWFCMNLLPEYGAVNLIYFMAFKKFPNLKNPKTLNEKISWRKLYQRDTRFPLFADKITVKDEIEKIIGKEYVIETLWTGETPEEIPFDTLKPPYVIKVSHSSEGNIFIRADKDINKEKIVDDLNKQLRFSHGCESREWGYRDIPHRVLIECMIEMPNNEVPEDYKFFVYDGHASFVQVDYGRFTEHKRNFYSRDWEFIPTTYQHYPNTDTPMPAPANLKEMVLIAEKIGKQFDFARVDLYSTPKGVLFGEVTFYPGAGRGPFVPEIWDEKFGEPWKIKK
ncbi:MAG: ATP-grasp fold amidoligase family protein [Bdellovibrionales bacterium]